MTLLAVVAIAGVAAPLLQGTVHPYLNATRDLGLTAIDAKLDPRLAQFRAFLRMIATQLQDIGEQTLALEYFSLDSSLSSPPDRIADVSLWLNWR